MLFTNSNPSSCPFSSCSIASQSNCTGYYSSIGNGCSKYVLSVTSSGILSLRNITYRSICCQYAMSCQANGQTQTSNSFQLYVPYYGYCDDNASYRTEKDISPSLSPPNKNYVINQGISNIFQEEVQISDYFYFPNNFYDSGARYCTCNNCTVTPSCIIKTCLLFDSTLTNVISQFSIFPHPNSTFVFQIQTSSTISQISVKLRCKTQYVPTYVYSNQFLFSISAAASTVVSITGFNQATTINLLNFISSQAGYCNMFQKSVTSCQIFFNGQISPNVVSSSISGTNLNVIFDPIKSTQSGNFQIFCYLSNGLAFTNYFTIQLNLCNPSIIVNSIYSQQASSATVQFSVFTPTSSDSNPTYCSFKQYQLFDSSGLIDVSSKISPYSFNTVTGEFKITNYSGYFSQFFYVQVTNKLNLAPINTASIKSGSINVTYYEKCNPQIKGLANLLSYSINTLTFPYTVFDASKYSSTSNPTYCTLSFSVINLDSSNITLSQFMKFDSKSGLFQITSYKQNDLLKFEQIIKFQVTSKHSQSSYLSQTISQQISINIYTCFPSISNQSIQNSYNVSVAQDASIDNPQYTTIFDAQSMTFTASLNQFCLLSFQTYFQNGTLASKQNSNFYNVQSAMILQITKNINSTQTYYLKATSTSANPSYSNSQSSKLFTINVIAYVDNTNIIATDQTDNTVIKTSYQTDNTVLKNSDQTSSASAIKTSDQSICKNDVVEQIKTMPQKNEPYYSSYKSIDGNPVLFLNLSQKESINVDIKSRFKNSMSKVCTLSYHINQIVFDNGTSVNRQTTNRFISLIANGVLTVKKQSKYEFDHLKVYIVAQNKAYISSSKSGYLIDLSVFSLQSLSDQSGLNNSQTKLNKSQACTAFISNLNQRGVVKIVFNDIMNTNFNISSINSSNTYIFIKPGGNRQEYEDFDPSTLQFTWSVISFIKNTMLIDLNFDQPLMISPLIQQDQLFINFNRSRNLLFCSTKKTFLDSGNQIISHSIPSQVASDQSFLLQSVGTSGSIFSNGPSWLLISGGAVALLGYGNMDYYIIYVRSLQFILLMPGIPIVLPANVVTYFSMIKTVAGYDILSYVDVWSLPGPNQIIVDRDAPIKISDQMQNIGYQNRNALYGLGTFTFIIYLYFIRLGLVMIIKIYFKISKQRLTKNKNLIRLENGLFYNNLYGLAIEGMIEFLINGYLNLMTVEKTTNGEIMGALLSAFSISLSSTVLPLTILWMIYSKNEKQLSSKKFEEQFGALFDGLNLKLRSSRFYFFVFWLRRMISISLFLLINPKMASVVLVVILFFNIIYTIYIGNKKRLKNRQLNYQEYFNEFCVSGCYYMMIILTEWVQSQAKKFFHGFMIIYLVIFYSFVNVLLILYVNFNTISVVFLKYYNLVIHYFNSKFQNDNQNEISKSENEKFKINDKGEKIENLNIMDLIDKNYHIANEQNIKEMQEKLKQNTIEEKKRIFLQERSKQTQNNQQQIAQEIILKYGYQIDQMYSKIKLQIQDQKNQKKKEQLKWKKQNQPNTLKKLIENPKEFLNPKLVKIVEENEMILTPQAQNTPSTKAKQIEKSQDEKQKFQIPKILSKNEIELIPQEKNVDVKIYADLLMKKHSAIQKIDSDGSIQKSIENIYQIINSSNSNQQNDLKRKYELTKIRDVLKIDLILLKSSQSYKDYKFWDKKFTKFEDDLNQILSGFL